MPYKYLENRTIAVGHYSGFYVTSKTILPEEASDKLP